MSIRSWLSLMTWPFERTTVWTTGCLRISCSNLSIAVVGLQHPRPQPNGRTLSTRCRCPPDVLSCILVRCGSRNDGCRPCRSQPGFASGAEAFADVPRSSGTGCFGRRNSLARRGAACATSAAPGLCGTRLRQRLGRVLAQRAVPRSRRLPFRAPCRIRPPAGAGPAKAAKVPDHGPAADGRQASCLFRQASGCRQAAMMPVPGPASHGLGRLHRRLFDVFITAPAGYRHERPPERKCS